VFSHAHESVYGINAGYYINSNFDILTCFRLEVYEAVKIKISAVWITMRRSFIKIKVVPVLN
jgi:hypothetical protein